MIFIMAIFWGVIFKQELRAGFCWKINYQTLFKKNFFTSGSATKIWQPESTAFKLWASST